MSSKLPNNQLKPNNLQKRIWRLSYRNSKSSLIRSTTRRSCPLKGVFSKGFYGTRDTDASERIEE